MAAGLPVEIVGLGGLLTTPEVVDVVATLRVLVHHNAGTALARLLTGARCWVGCTRRLRRQYRVTCSAASPRSLRRRRPVSRSASSRRSTTSVRLIATR